MICAKTMYAEANEVKKWDRYASSDGTEKDTAGKGEYSHFTISPFHHCVLCTVVPYLFYHLTIFPFHSVNVCVLSAQYQDISFTISLCKNGSVFLHHFSSRHFNFSPLFHNFIAKRCKKAARNQNCIELFGLFSDASDSEEDIGKNKCAV